FHDVAVQVADSDSYEITRTWTAKQEAIDPNGIPVTSEDTCDQKITLVRCNDDPPFLDLRNTTPASPGDSQVDTEKKFMDRAKAATRLNACLPLRHETLVGQPLCHGDFGTEYHIRLMARLAYKDYFNTDTRPDGTSAREEAIESLRGLYAFWQSQS